MARYLNLCLLTISCIVFCDAQSLSAGSTCQMGSQCASGACKRGSSLPQSAGNGNGQCCNDKGKSEGCLACFDDRQGTDSGSCIICGPGYELKNRECVKCSTDTPLSYPVNTWSSMTAGAANSGGCYKKTNTMSITAGDGCEATQEGAGKACDTNYCGIMKNSQGNRLNTCPSYCALTAPSTSGEANQFPNSCRSGGHYLTKSNNKFYCKKSGGDSAFVCACCRPFGKNPGETCSNDFECYGGDCRGSKCCAPEDANGSSMSVCNSNSGTTGTTSGTGSGSCTDSDCGKCMCSCQALNGGVQTSQTIKSTEAFCNPDGCTKRLGESACPSQNSQRSAIFTKEDTSSTTTASAGYSLNSQICAMTVGLCAAAAAATALNGRM